MFQGLTKSLNQYGSEDHDKEKVTVVVETPGQGQQSNPAEKKIIGFTTMTGDTLHPGHLDFLHTSKLFCDILIVGLTTDEFAKQQKRLPYFCYEHRRALLLALDCVDTIVPNRGETKKRMQEMLHFDRVFIGSDYIDNDEYKDLTVPVTFIPRAVHWSSTGIISELESRTLASFKILAYGIYGPIYVHEGAQGKLVIKPVNIGLGEVEATNGEDAYCISNPLPRNWKTGQVVENKFPMVAGINPYRELNIIPQLQGVSFFPYQDYEQMYSAPSQTFSVKHDDKTPLDQLVRERQFPQKVVWIKQKYAGEPMTAYVRKHPDSLPRILRVVKEQIEILRTQFHVVHGDLHPNNICISADGQTISFIDWGWCMSDNFVLTTLERGYYQYCLRENIDWQHFTDSLSSFGLAADTSRV